MRSVIAADFIAAGGRGEVDRRIWFMGVGMDVVVVVVVVGGAVVVRSIEGADCTREGVLNSGGRTF